MSRGRRSHAPRSGGVSTQTQSLVEGMMRKSNLTLFQQRQLKSTMTGGGSLPRSCNPTSSYEPEAPAAPKARRFRVNPKTLMAQKHGGIRTINKIKPIERDQFVPKDIGPSRDMLKDQLADINAYGPAMAGKIARLRAAHRAGKLPQLQEASRPRSSRAASPTTFSQEDTAFILGEIREREHYLQQMNKLGKTSVKHSRDTREEIEAELAQKRHMYSVMKDRTR